MTSALVIRSRRKASEQSSITTTSTTAPGRARASCEPIASPDTPPAQPSPKTGIRCTFGRKANRFADARFNAWGRDAGGGNGHNNIDVAGRKLGALQRLFRDLNKKRVSALEIGLGPLRPVALLVEPLDWADGIAPLDPRIGKDIDQTRIAIEQALEEALHSPCDLGLVERIRRHCGGLRQHRNRFSHR